MHVMHCAELHDDEWLRVTFQEERLQEGWTVVKQ